MLWKHFEEGVKLHASSELLCGSVFFFFFYGMGGKKVYKIRRLKGWKERTDVSAGRKHLFMEKILILY